MLCETASGGLLNVDLHPIWALLEGLFAVMIYAIFVYDWPKPPPPPPDDGEMMYFPSF